VKAVAWHGKRDVRVEEVPDPGIRKPDDAIVRITSSGVCGSDLHLYEVMTPYLNAGNVLGHEPMGIVEEVGPEVTSVAPGDRVVVPFNISCGSCWMCSQGLHSQCETTQNREHGTGASLFGYTTLYGEVPGGQAEYLRVPFGNTLPIKVPDGPPDDRFLFLSDVLPTAWQGVEYADVPDGGTLLVLGLGPIGEMATRIAQHRGYRVLAVDLVPDRLERARSHGVEVYDLREHEDDLVDVVRAAGLLPDAIQRKLMETASVDRLHALYLAIELVRRGGTISISGVYGGMADPLPLRVLFDKQVQIRMGQANVLHWVPEIMPLLLDGDPLRTDSFASHHLPLSEAPSAYEQFQKKEDGSFKVVLQP